MHGWLHCHSLSLTGPPVSCGVPQECTRPAGLASPPRRGGLIAPLGVTAISSTRARTPGSRWARCTRWPGLDRNPLRRPADRIEAVLRFAVLSLLLTAVPITTTVVGHAVDHLEHMGRRMAHRAALDRAPRLRIMPAGLLDGVCRMAPAAPFACTVTTAS
jgi:hypothetical protein